MSKEVPWELGAGVGDNEEENHFLEQKLQRSHCSLLGRPHLTEQLVFEGT